MINSIQLRLKRKIRQRFKMKRTVKNKHRLVVHRTNNHIYAQILDAEGIKTILTASTLSKEIRDVVTNGGNKNAAAAVGKLVAEMAKKNNVSNVVFDRSGFLYHGRIKTLADSAREHGLVF